MASDILSETFEPPSDGENNLKSSGFQGRKPFSYSHQWEVVGRITPSCPCMTLMFEGFVYKCLNCPTIYFSPEYPWRGLDKDAECFGS